MTVVSAVNENTNNISFSSRYINIHKPETFPDKLLKSIENNTALDEFIHEGEPKTLWEKVKNFFKRDEYLDLYYDKYTEGNSCFVPADEFIIDMGKYFKNNVWRSEKGLRIRAALLPQKTKTPEERIIKEFESIKDFNEKLSRDFEIIEV